MHIGNHKPDPQKSGDDDAAHVAHGGGGGGADALEHGGQHLGDGENDVAPADDHQLGNAQLHHFLPTVCVFLHKQTQQRAGKQGDQAGSGNNKCDAAQAGLNGDLIDALILACAVALGSGAEGGGGQAGHKRTHIGGDGVGGGVACHHGLAKAVDGGLQQHIGKGEGNVANAGGNAHRQHLSHMKRVKLQLLQPQLVLSLRVIQNDKVYHRIDGLGSHSGQGNTLHTHAENENKQGIQQHICQTAENVQHHGKAGIAVTVENIGHKGAKHPGWAAQQTNEHV